MPYLTKVIVDSEQKFCANKVVMARRKQNVISSDHSLIILEFSKMPKA